MFKGEKHRPLSPDYKLKLAVAALRKYFCAHLFFSITDIFCAKTRLGVGACLYMLQDGHWLASFEVIPPPQKLIFPRPKKRIGFLYNSLLKIETAIFDLIFL